MMILRLLILFLVVCSGFTSARAQSPTQPPNILWIIGENFDLDFGCYGAKNVHTPNVDSLATAGIRYTNVFSTSPVCAPSRSAFMTGMYQTTTDTHHMRSHRSDDFRLPPGVRPITQRLHDAGYITANLKTIGDRVIGTGKLDLNFVNEGQLYTTDDWEKLKPGQPFFAQINMPEAEYDIYDRKSAEKDRVKWVGEEWHPKVATPENVTPPPYYPDHPITRQEWARYLNSVTGTDVRVGWILDRLEQDGLADDTIVVFFSDNGRLEARGIHWCWDSGLHVPMVIRWPKNYPAPKQIKPGAVSDELISLIDLTATTLWMAGIEPPVGMQGRRFLGDAIGPSRKYVFSARDRIDETEIRLRSVRDKRYHYVRNFTPGAGFTTLNRYKEKCFLVKPLMRKLHAEGKLTGPPAELMKPFPDEQLYDTQADPYEIQNLTDSDDASHQEALLRMRAALDTWIVETGDRGEIPEPQSVVAPFEKEMHDWFGTPDWYSKGE
ncbi:Arylsulfatase [Stieleria neptunia]|uniref:Arylsulfatase n=1 Tax=Stieleria neptunia TaxID=2527979 RepID=A0A518HMI7_9BACT|nr:sulfatase [Stieleria neptunia]QDV42066.1 Arylsulfatase [Stieleria neptunia]